MDLPTSGEGLIPIGVGVMLNESEWSVPVWIRKEEERIMNKIAALVVLLLGGMVSAKEIGGVTLTETLSAGGENLVLNGAGLRKKLFVKVYAGGLYLKAKTTDAPAIVASDEPMAIRMHFLYGVSAKRLIGAWNDGFKAALGKDRGSLQAKIDAFNALFQRKAEKGDIYDLIYTPGSGVALVINGENQGKVEGHDFKKAVFSIWLGEKLADGNLESVKKGMLGG